MKILRKSMIIIVSIAMTFSLTACQVDTSAGNSGEPEEFRQYRTAAINYVEQTYPGMEYELIKAGYAKATSMLTAMPDSTKIEYTFENTSSGETFVVTCDTYNNRIYDDYTGSYYDDYSDSYDDYSDSYDEYSDDYNDNYDDYYNDYDSDYYSDDYDDSYDEYSDSYDDYYSDDYNNNYDDYNDNYDDYYSDQYQYGEQI